ncbi:MAG: flagellar motor switch protein FliN/FliY [Candidatus Paceibacteria bacterium]|jgi:flagellar motor switch protein FliN/FliY
MTDETTEENTNAIEGAIDKATEAVAIQANELPDLGAPEGSGQPIGLDGVLGVPVQLTVRIGQTRMSLSQLVDLGPGSLVPLDRDAHEPADIYVNGKLIARGEVVTIDNKYAVRICDIAEN